LGVFLFFCFLVVVVLTHAPMHLTLDFTFIELNDWGHIFKTVIRRQMLGCPAILHFFPLALSAGIISTSPR
jgi:hypothetical protein